MKYTLTKICNNEYIMNITEGAIMIPDAYKLTKKVAWENKVAILKVTQNGVDLCTYFTNLDVFRIA